MAKTIYDDTSERDPLFMVEHINTLLAKVKELEKELSEAQNMLYWYKTQASKYENKWITLKTMLENDRQPQK